MKWNFILPVTILFFMNSCHPPEKDKIFSGEEEKVKPPIPPKVTVLADLPDSLQPKVTYLDKSPKPVTKIFSIPSPTKSLIDSMTGLLLPFEASGKSYFTNYTTDDGLALDIVHTTYMDKAGNLWFGTVGGGVSRFDGKTFSNFTIETGLADNRVWNILEDSSGDMWFATVGGISRYNGRTFTNYTTAQGLQYNDVGGIIEDNAGNLWFCTYGGGVSCYDGKTFTNFNASDGLTSNFIRCMMKDHHGNLWFGTRNGGVLKYEVNQTDSHGHFSVFHKEQGWDTITINCIKEDNKGLLWIGTNGYGLIRYDGTSFLTYNTSHGLKSDNILDILEDRKRTLWVSTLGGGISRFDGKSFLSFTTAQGLSNNLISSLTEDRDGNLWAGTYGSGVSRYNGNAFTNFTSGPLNSNVTSITEDMKGTLWFGTDRNGICSFDGRVITEFTTDQGLTRNTVIHIMQDKSDGLWFATYYGGGVSCLKIDTIKNNQDIGRKATLTNFTTLQGLAHDAVYAILEDKRGNFWFPTYGGGVSRYDGKTFMTYTTKQGLVSNAIMNVLEDTLGNLWFTSLGSEGVSLFDGKRFINYTSEQGLADNLVTSISEDKDGNLWFGTNVGLSFLPIDKLMDIYTPEDKQPFLFETFTMKDGLPEQSVLYILSEKNGDINIGTNAGITILKGGHLAFRTPGAIESFSNKNGYPLKSALPLFKDSNGKLWISTSSDLTGLVVFDESGLNKNFSPPVVLIQRIDIKNEKISWYNLPSEGVKVEKQDSNPIPAYISDEINTFGRRLRNSEKDSMQIKFKGIQFDSIARWYPIPINLVLPYRHNSITLHFNALITSRNNLVKYQYILEGYDKDWSPISENASATFGNIQEGQYTFKVKGRSPDGVWSEPVSYSFQVLPPVHRTWWAYSFYSLFFLSMLFTGHLFQKRRTIQKEQEKEKQKQAILNERLRISRDLHDEVGATLSGISMYTHIAKEQIKSESKDVVLHSLDIMQDSASDMVNKINDIVWLLNPDQAHLRQLVERLEQYAGHLAEMKGIQVNVGITDRISEIELPIEVRRNIFLIFKEAINNAFKYSQADTLELYVRDFDHTVEFELQDNGAGFDAEAIKRGNGLNNMQQRAEEIKAILTIVNRKPGTRITLKYKIT